MDSGIGGGVESGRGFERVEGDGRRSTAGGSGQISENAMPGGPEPISDGNQVFDPQDATVDRVARNPDFDRSERRRFNIWGFLGNLRK